MKWNVRNVVSECGDEVKNWSSDIIRSNDASLISNTICLLSCFDEGRAESIFEEFASLMRGDPDKKVLSHFLISAKELGYNQRQMKVDLVKLESQKHCGNWSEQIWLNSLVLKALGRYDITYPKMVNYLLEQRLSNGSWFEKVWVTSYALEGLFYSQADPSELSLSADYIKNAMEDDHWCGEERGKMSMEKVTSRALQSLLLIGEGYEEEPISSAIQWTVERIKETDDLFDLVTLSIPLVYIVKGRAQKETNYRRSTAVEFRETRVEIGEQIVGDKIEGDKVEGDKVDEKIGAGAKVARDGVILDRSRYEGDNGDGAPKIAEDGVLIDRSENILKSSVQDITIPTNYSMFSGKEIEGGIRYCPGCGKKVEKEWKCCVECGLNMDEIRSLFEW